MFVFGDRLRDTLVELRQAPSTEPTALIVTATPTPEPPAPKTPTPAPTFTPTPSPNLRHMDEKLYMLELINAERASAGVSPVVLGDNIAAQLHAEASLTGCYSSHWDSDGLKPYMRYSLAGGYQSNGENGSGLDFCITSRTESALGFRYTPLTSIRTEIRDAVDGWMDSPGHRDNILDRHHKKVNIGLAWDRYNLMAYQHFEGGHVEYDQMPLLNDGLLQLAGRTTGEVELANPRDLGVQIYYDQPPHSLTRGQLSRTYCYDNGRHVASLRPSLTGSQFYDSREFTKSYKPCPSPYDVPANAPAPSSPDEAHLFWQEAYDKSLSQVGQSIKIPWITAAEWRVGGDRFAVRADLTVLLRRFGAGVYTVAVWGSIGGEDAVISEYSIFHGVTPPDTYILESRQ